MEDLLLGTDTKVHTTVTQTGYSDPSTMKTADQQHKAKYHREKTAK